MAIPKPEPGLVVHFNYLWSRERDAGHEEARYARPCVVVISHWRKSDGGLMALLAQITHSEPGPEDRAIEIPPKVKVHLGLDEQRSWIILTEVNETGWPGYDLRPNAAGEYVYGFLPVKLFERVKSTLLDALKQRLLKLVPR